MQRVHSMIKKILVIIFSLIITGLSPAFAEKSNMNDRFILEFIGEYGKAVESCDKDAKNRILPDVRHIEPILQLSPDELRGFLIYKSGIATKRCTELKSGYPIALLLFVAGSDKTSPQMRVVLDNLLKLLSSKHEIAAFYTYRSISIQKRNELDAIEYFNDPFDMLKVYYLVKEYQEIESGKNRPHQN